MSRILDSVTAYFAKTGWIYNIIQPPGEPFPIVTLTMQADNDVKWTMFAQCREAFNQVAVYSVFPLLIPPERQADIAEFTARLNYWLGIGNFEIDFDSGYLRFRTSLEVGNHPLDQQLLDPLIQINATTMVHYLPFIVAVVRGDHPLSTVLMEIDTLLHSKGQTEDSQDEDKADD
jgi:hypothetical protein